MNPRPDAAPDVTPPVDARVPAPMDAGADAPIPDAEPDAARAIDADAPAVDAAAADGRAPDPDRGRSGGCGMRSGTGLQARTITVRGVERTFLRFVPAGYEPATPVALVLGFHGSGGTSERARNTFELEARAGNAAIFVYPQGLPNAAGENRWDGPDPASNDYAFIDDVIRRTEEAYCVDRNRVFATGFSNGARFTANLGCLRGDVLRAIAPVAPGGEPATLPFTGCVGEVAVWEGLGTADAEHEAGALRVRDHYAAANGCAATRTPTTPMGCEAYDGCRREVPTVWCTYPLGHMWPPIAPAGVWNFFSRLR